MWNASDRQLCACVCVCMFVAVVKHPAGSKERFPDGLKLNRVSSLPLSVAFYDQQGILGAYSSLGTEASPRNPYGVAGCECHVLLTTSNDDLFKPSEQGRNQPTTSGTSAQEC